MSIGRRRLGLQGELHLCGEPKPQVASSGIDTAAVHRPYAVRRLAKVIAAVVELRAPHVPHRLEAGRGAARGTLIWDPDVWMSFKTAEKVLSSDPGLLTGSTAAMAAHDGRLRPGISRTRATADVTLLSADVMRSIRHRRRPRGARDRFQRDATR